MFVQAKSNSLSSRYAAFWGFAAAFALKLKLSKLTPKAAKVLYLVLIFGKNYVVRRKFVPNKELSQHSALTLNFFLIAQKCCRRFTTSLLTSTSAPQVLHRSGLRYRDVILGYCVLGTAVMALSLALYVRCRQAPSKESSGESSENRCCSPRPSVVAILKFARHLLWFMFNVLAFTFLLSSQNTAAARLTGNDTDQSMIMFLLLTCRDLLMM